MEGIGISRNWNCQYFPFQKLEGADATGKCDALTSKERTPPRRAKLNFIFTLKTLYVFIIQLCFYKKCVKQE